MTDMHEKPGTGHVDTIDYASNHSSTGSPHGRNGEEQIILNLQQTGEEVGMTWRTIGAVTVSSQAFLLKIDFIDIICSL